MGWIFKGPLPHGRDFLRFAKFGTLQYSVIKPATALVALVLAPAGLYREVRWPYGTYRWEKKVTRNMLETCVFGYMR